MAHWRTYPAGIPTPELLRLAEEALEQGDLIGAGNWYFHAKRRGTPEAKKEIRELLPKLEAAASLGDMEAKELVAAVLLDQGRDPQRAADLFGEVANLGSASAKRELGFMLMNGIGMPSDPERASNLFRSSAESGDGYAAFNLSVNYYNGIGVRRNFREFSHWLKKSAELGIPEACAVLADQLAERGNQTEALNWYVKAAESGHAAAMFAAGVRFRDGAGTDPDPVQAVRWFLSMLDRGNGDGIHEAIAMAPSMTRTQIIEAGRLARRESEAQSLLRRYK
ncbi:tetratricopeptide repeat protein [Streptomyces zaomyceticus]|uniref:tetratricopeptide repeat protein n=1 Tax=Streptomyces zaomyceticus TaxID=68286 RepID=UPI00167BA78D|nr:tetratricopeptide repeat protein [Streptomyces zaomyceticus]GHG37056.1 hypothetical protein GCM10018791_63340 [Streptomyces zaomyceticus]